MNKRVVITGLGVVSPNAIGITAFKDALIKGKSGIQFQEDLKNYKFGCQVAGIPKIDTDFKRILLALF